MRIKGRLVFNWRHVVLIGEKILKKFPIHCGGVLCPCQGHENYKLKTNKNEKVNKIKI